MRLWKFPTRLAWTGILLLTSYLSGVMVQNQRRGLVSKVLLAQVADMRSYIARKQKDQFMNLVRRSTGT